MEKQVNNKELTRELRKNIRFNFVRLAKYSELNGKQQGIIQKKYNCIIDDIVDKRIDELKQELFSELGWIFGIKTNKNSINIQNNGVYGISVFCVSISNSESYTITKINALMKKFLQLSLDDNRLAKFDDRTIKVFLSLCQDEDFDFDLDSSLECINFYIWRNLEYYPRLNKQLKRLITAFKNFLENTLNNIISEIKVAADFYYNETDFISEIFSDVFFDLDTLNLVKHIKPIYDGIEIYNVLSDLSYALDKLKQDFSINKVLNKKDIEDIKILINTLEVHA